MPQRIEYQFKHREVVEALIKHKGLHEGLWMLNLAFGVQGGFIGEDEHSVDPAAIVGVKMIGLTKVKEPHPLALDAAEVNPAPKRKGNGENAD
jgi:hypothetical protein